ncbi:hypothetical protein F5Y02DRAFT_425842 [Annulohypoxylon stygium]|nr:hypothetical protein F5Y02DRAFT_425842 [Annulohypoxylon stygium]
MDSLIVHLVDTNSFYISPTEVDQAFRLSTEGSQRLQSVSETETTSFYFCTSHNEHYGAASIDIHPVSRDDKNPFYKPTLRYSLCCGEAPEGRFKEQFQAVYNTCIRPIQWNFHNDGSRVPLSVQTLPPTCRERSELGLKLLKITGEKSPNVHENNGNSSLHAESRSRPSHPFEGQQSEEVRTVPNREPSNTESFGDSSSPSPICQNRKSKDLDKQVSKKRPQRAKPVGPPGGDRQNEMVNRAAPKRLSCIQLASDDAGTIGEPPPNKRKKSFPRRSDEEIAKSIALKINNALRDIGKEEVDEITTLKNKLSEMSIDDRHKSYLQMADELWERAEKPHDALKEMSWANRFYSSCMRYILRKRRKLTSDNQKDRQADSTRIINRLVDLLSTSAICHICPGSVCRHSMMTYTALARMNHTLSEMNDKGEDRRSKFIKLLASELCYTISQTPLNWPLINPAAVISYLWREPVNHLVMNILARN